MKEDRLKFANRGCENYASASYRVAKCNGKRLLASRNTLSRRLAGYA